MLRFVVAAVLVALVYGQNMTMMPEVTTQAPTLEHTFNTNNLLWFLNIDHLMIVMKTDSGCYSTHVKQHDVHKLTDAEHLLKLEAEIVHHVTHAHHFTVYTPTPDMMTAELTAACTTFYHYHH